MRKLTAILILCTTLVSAAVVAQNQNRALVIGSSYTEVKARNELKPKDNLSFFGFEADTVAYFLCDHCKGSLDDKYPADLVALAFYNDTLYRITFAYKLLIPSSAAGYKKVGKSLSKRYNCQKQKASAAYRITDIISDGAHLSTIEHYPVQACDYRKGKFLQERVKTINQDDQSFKEYGTFTYLDPEVSSWFEPIGKRQKIKSK